MGEKLVVAVGALVLSWGLLAGEIPRAEPVEVGISADGLAALDDYYKAMIRDDKIAGAVVLVARHGKVVHWSALGASNRDTGRAMHDHDIFRIASMTKPITAVALMMLHEQGRFELDDPLSEYLPEFADIKVTDCSVVPYFDCQAPPRRPLTIHDILNYTAGFPMGDDYYRTSETLEQAITRLVRKPLNYQPGEMWSYNAASDVQARLIEVLSDMPFDTYLKEKLFDPLGMVDSGFRIAPGDADRLPELYQSNTEGELVKLDDQVGAFRNYQWLEGFKMHCGMGCLVASAADYWRFAQMMLNGGELNGVRILRPETVANMTRSHLHADPDHNGMPIPALPGNSWGLGVGVVEDPVLARTEAPEGTYFWTGYFGTVFWVDPVNDLVVVGMIQQPMGKSEGLGHLRALVYGAMTE